MPEFRVVFRGVMDGQNVNIQRFWLNNTASPNIQEFADALGSDFQTAIAPITPTALTWTDLYIIPARPGGLGLPVVPSNFPFSGADAGQQYLPPYVCALAVYGGVLNIHPRQGRNRFPGILEGQVTQGNLTAPAQTAWGAVATVLSTSQVLSSLWTAILWSDEYQTQQLIAGSVIRAELSTQNSRKI